MFFKIHFHQFVYEQETVRKPEIENNAQTLKRPLERNFCATPTSVHRCHCVWGDVRQRGCAALHQHGLVRTHRPGGAWRPDLLGAHHRRHGNRHWRGADSSVDPAVCGAGQFGVPGRNLLGQPQHVGQQHPARRQDLRQPLARASLGGATRHDRTFVRYFALVQRSWAVGV